MGVFSSSPPTTTLKKELQRKLNHSRTRSRRRAGDYPKIPTVGRAARGIRRSKLRSVEDFEKLGAKLDRKSLIVSYFCLLQQGKVFSTSMRYVPAASPSAPGCARINQNSCIVCSFAASNQKSTHAWLDPFVLNPSSPNPNCNPNIIPINPHPRPPP